jgi:hypothetical protein
VEKAPLWAIWRKPTAKNGRRVNDWPEARWYWPTRQDAPFHTIRYREACGTGRQPVKGLGTLRHIVLRLDTRTAILSGKTWNHLKSRRAKDDAQALIQR